MNLSKIEEIVENKILFQEISPVDGASINEMDLDIVRDYFQKYNVFDIYMNVYNRIFDDQN